MKNSKAIIKTLSMNDQELDKAVKIQGTIYDRKRKVSPDMAKKMERMLKRKSFDEVAEAFGVSVKAVRYNTDPEYRQMCISCQTGAHTGKDKITLRDRVTYKRSLVAEGLLAV